MNCKLPAQLFCLNRKLFRAFTSPLGLVLPLHIISRRQPSEPLAVTSTQSIAQYSCKFHSSLLHNRPVSLVISQKQRSQDVWTCGIIPFPFSYSLSTVSPHPSLSLSPFPLSLRWLSCHRCYYNDPSCIPLSSSWDFCCGHKAVGTCRKADGQWLHVHWIL